MSKPLLVLADPDVDALRPLEYRFLKMLGDSCDIEAITDVAYLDRFLDEPHDIEALLISEGWYDQRIGAQNVTCTFVLVETPSQERAYDGALHRICKYDNQKTIFNEVTSLCSSLRHEAAHDRKCQVLLFFSPVGGAGCTTVALGAAAALSSHYYRVLYVDAEFVQTFACFLDRHAKASPQMIAAMMRGSGNEMEALSAHVMQSGFDYVPPVQGGLAANGIPFEFFSRLVRSARDSGRYDFVVVDTDSVFDQEKSTLLGEADRVIVIGEQGASEAWKMTTFRNLLDAAVSDKFLFICNKFESYSVEANMAGNAEVFDWDGFIRVMKADELAEASTIGAVDDIRQLAQSFE